MINTAINRTVINKTKEHWKYNDNFKNEELSAEELLDTVLNGYAICVAGLKPDSNGNIARKTENFLWGQIIGIDIDNGNKVKKIYRR